ncbi:MAG: hypothetical protein ACREOI_30995 [bacterium]
MTKPKLVETIRAAIQEWAQQHSVDLALLEVNPTDIELDVRIIVVARHGFENWSEIDRHESLYKYLRLKLDEAGIVNLVSLITMPEEEYDQYERVEVS